MEASDISMSESLSIEQLKSDLAKATPSTRKRIFEKFVMAVLGSIPWVGGVLGAVWAYKAESAPLRTDELQSQWLQEHVAKLHKLKEALDSIAQKFENLGAQIEERIQSEEYLMLVRRAFRAWDRADTNEKREHVAKLIANAAGTRICSDDVVRLFIDWIDRYHEAHFRVIQEIWKRPGSTRHDVWSAIGGAVPREDSPEADLFRLLFRELTLVGVIRQERKTTASGDFLRKTPARHRGPAPATMKSGFDAEEGYELTALGEQFVSYALNEVVPRLGNQPGTATA